MQPSWWFDYNAQLQAATNKQGICLQREQLDYCLIFDPGVPLGMVCRPGGREVKLQQEAVDSLGMMTTY